MKHECEIEIVCPSLSLSGTDQSAISQFILEICKNTVSKSTHFRRDHRWQYKQYLKLMNLFHRGSSLRLRRSPGHFKVNERYSQVKKDGGGKDRHYHELNEVHMSIIVFVVDSEYVFLHLGCIFLG